MPRKLKCMQIIRSSGFSFSISAAMSASPLRIQSTAEGFKLYCSLKYYINYLKTSLYQHGLLCIVRSCLHNLWLRHPILSWIYRKTKINPTRSQAHTPRFRTFLGGGWVFAHVLGLDFVVTGVWLLLLLLSRGAAEDLDTEDEEATWTAAEQRRQSKANMLAVNNWILQCR